MYCTRVQLESPPGISQHYYHLIPRNKMAIPEKLNKKNSSILINGAQLLLRVAAYCCYVHFMGWSFCYAVTGKRRVEDLSAAVYFTKHINRLDPSRGADTKIQTRNIHQTKADENPSKNTNPNQAEENKCNSFY